MNTVDALIVTVHLGATAAMVGLIWFVQVVHYPLFAAVDAAGFVAYERAHQRLTAMVVGPPMAVEGVTAVWLAVDPPAGVARIWPVVGLGLLGVVQASTTFLQVPLHAALGEVRDEARLRRLVRTNWIRTIGWSARGVVAGVIVVAVLRR